MSKRIGRRSIAALLAAVMMFTAMPLSVNAAEMADVADEALEEVSGESWTEAAEAVVEEKGEEEGGNSYNTEEQASKSGEGSESKTEQTESLAATEVFNKDETGAFDDSEEMETATESITTQENMEDLTEESESESEMEEETAEEGIDLKAASDFTRDDAVAWVKSQNGIGLDYDGLHGVQCVDLIYYYYKYLGVTVQGGSAYYYVSNTLPTGWTRIPYYDGFVAEPGDIAVWDRKDSPVACRNGHIGIVMSADKNGFTSAEQNYGDNGNEPCNVNLWRANYSFWQYGKIACVIRPNFKDQSGNTPKGALDEVRGGAGSVFVRGWAMDDDLPYQSLVIDVYIGGPAGSGVPYHRITADKTRADIGYGKHGFEETIPTDKTGVQDVYVYALNVGEGNDNPQIGKGTVTISDRKKGAYMNTGYARSIPDGYYHIASSFGDQWWLTISEPSNINGANVQLWDYSIRDFECDEQLFYFKFIDEGGGKGFYKITNKKSGKCLDVKDASEYMYDENGNPTNVQQHEDNGSSAQQWAIREVDGGEKGILYTLQARCSGFCLDLWLGESSLKNGANISMCTDNGTPAQRWRIVPYAPAVGQTIEDGEYQIVYSTVENKAIGAEGNDNGANIVLSSSYKGDYRQTFDVKYLGNGYYSIINKNSGLSLDVAGAYRVRGTNAWLWECIDYDAQKWIIQSCGNEYYNIISKCNGLYLHLDGADAADGTNINMWNWETGNTIKWKFVPCEKPKLSTPNSTLSNTAAVDAGTKFYLNKNDADDIYYTWDGTTPTKQSTKYSDSTGLTIPTGKTTCTLKAFGVKEGYQDSDVLEITYTVKQNTSENPSEEESSEVGGSDDTPEDEDPQEGVKWHYNEQKVTYKDLSQYGQIVTNIKPKTYDGTPYKPAVKVTAIENGKTVTLTEGIDYRVLYFSNTHAGTGSVIVRGNGIYKGTISKKFEIKKKSCQKLKVVTTSMLTGDSATPKIYVYDGNILLKENKDYTLDGITPNFTATKGTKQIYVMAAQNSDYEGIKSAKITVYDADKGRIKGIIDRPENATLSQSTYQYTGKACKPTATVTVDGNTLTAGKDYTIKYQNNKDTGTAFATITGKGSYIGSVVKEFTIKPSNGEFTLKKPIAAVTYNGKLQKPKIIVTADGKTLKQNKDYTLTYTNNLHATDRAKVTVRGKGNYAAIPTKIFYFTIAPCHIRKASVKGGQGSLLITYAKHTLVEGVDYDVIYGDVSGKGKISVTIKAKEGSSFIGEVTKKIKQ